MGALKCGPGYDLLQISFVIRSQSRRDLGPWLGASIHGIQGWAVGHSQHLSQSWSVDSSGVRIGRYIYNIHQGWKVDGDEEAVCT